MMNKSSYLLLLLLIFVNDTHGLITQRIRRTSALRLRGGSFSCFGGSELQPSRVGPLSQEVENSSEIPGEGKPRRNIKYPELISIPFRNRPGMLICPL
jgi:hypothetical protein